MFTYVGQTDHDLDHLQVIYILTCRHEMLCKICTVQIQPRKHVLQQIMQIIRLPPGNVRQIIQIGNLFALPGRSYRS